MHRFTWTIPLVVMVLLLSGCFFSREIAQTRRQIEAAHPQIELEKQIVLNLGPLSLQTLEWVSRFAPDDAAFLADRYLDDIRRVKIGLFRRTDGGRLDDLSVTDFGFEKGWEVAVKVRREDARVWVMFRDEGKAIRDLYTVVLSEDDLVIARVHGRLDRLVARILEDRERGAWWTRDALEVRGNEDSDDRGVVGSENRGAAASDDHRGAASDDHRGAASEDGRVAHSSSGN